MKKQLTKRVSKRKLIESLKTIIRLLSSLSDEEFNRILVQPGGIQSILTTNKLQRIR